MDDMKSSLTSSLDGISKSMQDRAAEIQHSITSMKWSHFHERPGELKNTERRAKCFNN